MEAGLGHDFSDVRLHTDGRAAESARAVEATAYTVGSDVVFGAGRYAPSTDQGRRVLAHELAHVVQQGASPMPSGGTLTIRRQDDPSEREAEAVAIGPPAAPRELTSTPPVLARQTAGTAAVPCGMNCTDPAFLVLSIADREAQFAAQCPQGFPATGNTFFGKPIPAVSRVLRSKLLQAQKLAMRAMCIAGRDPSTFVLSGTIITYPTHRPAMDKAVDIDKTGQPYVMHEYTRTPAGTASVPETAIDAETRPVYDRIAFWSHYRTSIIPSGITSVRRPSRTSDSRRSWTNPSTGAQEPVTVGEIYDLLAQESTGMQGYFDLLRKPDPDLATEIEIFLMFNSDPDSTLSGLGLPIDDSIASAQAFRRRIADDYRLLGGSAAGLTALAGSAIASTTPRTPIGDRPFVGRNPEQGFLTMPREVVVALTDVGLTWGAIDFLGASGDVMHIDCRGLAGC